MTSGANLKLQCPYFPLVLISQKPGLYRSHLGNIAILAPVTLQLVFDYASIVPGWEKWAMSRPYPQKFDPIHCLGFGRYGGTGSKKYGRLRSCFVTSAV